ncbi:MAG: hypothetical protein ACAH07_06185 [Methylophilaceae bacterium]|nr:hypothetical protein [Methyloradius sp.]
MAISSVTNGYSNLLNSVYSTSGTSTTTTSTDTDISSILNQLESSASSSVTLNSTTTNPATQTYTAQGLLQQINASKLSNDKLLFGDDSSTDSSSDNSLPTELASLTSQLNGAATDTSGSQANIDLNADWATTLKTNPSMAPVLVQNEINKSLMSIFSSKD